MDPISATSQQTSLDSLRRRRAELRESMIDLEHALAAPVAGTGAPWPERVHAALEALSADFLTHVEITEGPDGLYEELLADAPRLADAVAHLTKEHGDITGLIEAAQTSLTAPEPDVDRVRIQGTELLGRLVRHRQRGSDLVYEAYEFDIGGDT